MEKISIIIPTYNRDKTIVDAVTSVLNQTYENIEIIIVDDASSDDTINVLQKLKNDRVQILINEENKGACYSRNRGINVATGEYIAFQDSDDIWLPNKLEICMKTFKENDCDFIFHQVRCMNVKGQPISPTFDFNNYTNKILHVLVNGGGNTQSMIGKAKCFEMIRFDERLPRSQDWELMIQIIEKFNVYFLKIPLVEYYMLADSISKSSQKGLIALDIIEKKHYCRYYGKYKKPLKYSYYKHRGELFALDHDLIEAKKNYKKALEYQYDRALKLKNLLINLHLYNIVRKIYRG